VAATTRDMSEAEVESASLIQTPAGGAFDHSPGIGLSVHGDWLHGPRRVNVVRWRTSNVTTGKAAASAASKVMTDPKATRGEKKAAASDLAQARKPQKGK